MGDYIEKDVKIDENDYDVQIIKESEATSNESDNSSFN